MKNLTQPWEEYMDLKLHSIALDVGNCFADEIEMLVMVLFFALVTTVLNPNGKREITKKLKFGE